MNEFDVEKGFDLGTDTSRGWLRMSDGDYHQPIYIEMEYDIGSLDFIFRRPTESDRKEFVDFLKDKYEEDNVGFHRALPGDSLGDISLTYEDSMIYTGRVEYRGPLDIEGIKNLYMGDFEPVSRSEYCDLIDQGVEDLKQMFERNNMRMI